MFSMWGPGEPQKQSPWGTGLPPSAAEKKPAPAGVWAEKAGAWGTAATAEPQKAGAWAEPVTEPNTVLSAPLTVSQKPNTSLGAWAKPLPGSPPLAPTGGPAAESPPLSVSPPPPAEALVVRCTGLPFSATIDSVLDFFDELDLDDDAVHLTLEPDGTPSGECFVTLGSEAALAVALDRDRKVMGHRYVGVERASALPPSAAAKPAVKKAAAAAAEGGGAVLRLRGLPYSASEAEVAAFFDGLRPASIAIGRDDKGRASGEARVEFGSEGEAQAALQTHAGKKFGTSSRYIELIRVPKEEAAGGGDTPTAVLQMRGLPFQVTEGEIAAFFKAGGFEITPGAVKLEKEGQATARFASANVATRALAALNHQYCGSRYVDLSFAAKP